MEVRIVIVDGKVRYPTISCIRGIAYGYLISVLVKEYRHDLQSFILFAYETLFRSLIHSLGSIFITAVNDRCSEIRIRSVGYRVRIVGKAVELFLEFRFLIKDIRDLCSHGTVEHKDDYVLSVPAQRNAGHLLGC